MVTHVLLAMGMLLLVAKIFGEIVERYGIASLVGEIIAGIVLGPILGWVVLGEFLNEFLMFGVIFMLLIAGLEVKFDDIKKHIYKAAVLAFFGGIASLFLGFVVGMIFFNNFIVSLAIGVAFVSTSNGTLFMILMRIGEFKSDMGKIIIAVTIADDIVGMLALSFFTMFMTGANVAVGDLGKLFLVSIGLYLFILSFGSKLFNRILDIAGFLRDEHILFTVPVIITFLLAFLTHHLSLSIAVGAFLAGVAMANNKFTDSVIRPKIDVMGYGFLLPLFYASIGTMLVFVGLDILLIIAILVTAILGKFIGCGLISRFFGHDWKEMKLIGLSMIPRGNENIGIVQIMLILGAFTMTVYTSIIFVMVMTVIATPILLKLFYKSKY